MTKQESILFLWISNIIFYIANIVSICIKGPNIANAVLGWVLSIVLAIFIIFLLEQKQKKGVNKMNKTELEEKIKNGESVWACNDFVYRVIPYKANEIAITGINTNMPAYELKDLFATKQQAEHYLNHANITRAEELPFLTWEEFKNNTLGFEFTDNIGNKYRCHIVRDYREGINYIVLYDKNGTVSIDEEWEANEENFYLAYDECVKLFKGK